MAPFRLFFPHAIVFGSILKWLRIVPSEFLRLLGRRPPCGCSATLLGSLFSHHAFYATAFGRELWNWVQARALCDPLL